jgi:hypothetical protein
LIPSLFKSEPENTASPLCNKFNMNFYTDAAMTTKFSTPTRFFPADFWHRDTPYPIADTSTPGGDAVWIKAFHDPTTPVTLKFDIGVCNNEQVSS